LKIGANYPPILFRIKTDAKQAFRICHGREGRPLPRYRQVGAGGAGECGHHVDMLRRQPHARTMGASCARLACMRRMDGRTRFADGAGRRREIREKGREIRVADRTLRPQPIRRERPAHSPHPLICSVGAPGWQNHGPHRTQRGAENRLLK
jgi:hypothetical protein